MAVPQKRCPSQEFEQQPQQQPYMLSKRRNTGSFSSLSNDNNAPRKFLLNPSASVSSTNNIDNDDGKLLSNTKSNGLLSIPAFRLTKNKDYYCSDYEDRVSDRSRINNTPLLNQRLEDILLKYTDSESDDDDENVATTNNNLKVEFPAGSGYLHTPPVTSNNNGSLIDTNDSISNMSTLKRKLSMSRNGSISCTSRRSSSQIPNSDLIARERCFDYIVQCIDETWARYCDTTSNAEVIAYGETNSNSSSWKNKRSTLSSHLSSCHSTTGYIKPLKISDSETDIEDENNPNSNSHLNIHMNLNFKKNLSQGHTTDVDDIDEENGIEYKSDTTIPTDCESETHDRRAVSTLPDSVKLQSLKHRLTKAKNDMEQTYDSNNIDDSILFWRRWDMIKYNAVEMMEEDDDDDLIDSVIDELEFGRYVTD
ncbi:hypothetical protein TBLA_0A04980 [Henningerozyma blattae CBS 6284]|uniref:Uncharacterized protein n=1 Tax=Henningerozyma blattae (strain ATCC 34711 / CBS 6284 / DSM 70876 / NBRC 10599 / NRRL Y-10934 / UCD 77-7) TaxID=1071380 RepID=I2GVY9_HENB6|nr:hypothetical protein TBLA_0A04980 [Tetrapisispora blattae CBS 6284]CCH58291.1 hypothetical protein TBLA_0A04980 [Tetrapisispora blattae CBS 6284]